MHAAERIDFVAIVTPNHLHHPVAMAALERGFDVVCDKPMTLDSGAGARDPLIASSRAAGSSASPTTTPATRW